ncbi:hypothetical protein V6N13_137858 [Hibiscus sabdariffa]
MFRDTYILGLYIILCSFEQFCINFTNEKLQQHFNQGVLEAIRVKCEGYPTHRTFSEFINRFAILAPDVLKDLVHYGRFCFTSAIVLQTGVRAMLARDEFETRIQNHSATIIQALLMEEKKRADEYEKKHAEAQELSELRRKKLEETEKKVYQLQDSLNRLVFSMTEQFSQLKTILQSSSNSASASPPIARVDYFDNSDNSDDASSNGSDFIFPASGRTSADKSTPLAKAPHVLVKDATATEVTG